MASIDPSELQEIVARGLAEDLGTGDLTTELTVPAEAMGRARIVQKDPGIFFGMAVVREVFRQVGEGACEVDTLMIEGQWRDGVPAELAFIYGPARALLAGERVALNLIGRLSGIATMTARYVVAAREGGRAAVLDTRKTTPGLRSLEKAAVLAGGGRNHRFGLDDAILIKENHIALGGGVERVVEAARADERGLPVEIECTDQAEVEAALRAGADRLLLDNMKEGDLRSAVELRDRLAPKATLEASGNASLETIGGIAATGVEMISVGALTHSAPTLDLSMLIEPATPRRG